MDAAVPPAAPGAAAPGGAAPGGGAPDASGQGATAPGASTPDAPSPAPGARPGGRRRRTRLLLTIAATALLLDVVSKLIVVATISPGENIRELGGLVYLTELRNTGAAFSFAEGATILFSLIAVAVAVVIVRTSRKLYSAAWATALGLVLGGALGNLVDRIARSPGFLRGAVVDWISVFAPDGRVWPVFNLADSAIVCGGILGALLAVRGIDLDGARGRDSEADAPTEVAVDAATDDAARG